MKQAKVRLNCVYGDCKPGQEAVMDYEFAQHYAAMGWVDILEVIEDKPEEKKEEKPAKKKK
jgi:hypothetical protein